MDLIINADDLGASTGVNRAVFQLMAKKKITSATILANGESVREAVENLCHFPECSFGIHLNLTQYRPLTSSEPIKSLLDDEGQFAGLDRIKSTSFSRGLVEAVFEEFCAQIDTLKGWGVKISHIDSHQHIHNRLVLFWILKRIQRRYSLRKVRISRNLYSPSAMPSRRLLLKKKLFNLMLRHYYRTTTTRGFGNLQTFVELGRLNQLPLETVEVMVHPNLTNDDGTISQLESDWICAMPVPVCLISYHQL